MPNVAPQTETDRIIQEWDTAMRQARVLQDAMPEFRHAVTRDEQLGLANAIFIRNAIKAAGRDVKVTG